MSNYCIGCKRELAKGQEDCHICGAPQSYFKFYFKSGLFFIIAMTSVAAYGFWYVEQVSLKLEIEKNNQATTISAEFNEKINQLELSLAKVQEELQQSKEAGSEVSKAADQEKEKLAAVEERATKAEARASWLSKENSRFRNQIAQLETKVKELETSINSATTVESPLPVEVPQEEVAETDSNKDSENGN